MIRMARSGTLSGYPDVAKSLGLDPVRMLARVGLSRARLNDPDSLIPAAAACRLLEDSAAGAEDFGLRMSETRGVCILGPGARGLVGVRRVRSGVRASSIERMNIRSQATHLAHVDSRPGSGPAGHRPQRCRRRTWLAQRFKAGCGRP
jgi:hypothetical protein